MQSISPVQESCVVKEPKLKRIRLTLPWYTAFPLKEEGWREWCFGFDLFLICFHRAQDILSLSPSQMKTLMSFVDNRRQIPKSMNINWQELGYEMEELRFASGLIHKWPTPVLLQWVYSEVCWKKPPPKPAFSSAFGRRNRRPFLLKTRLSLFSFKAHLHAQVLEIQGRPLEMLLFSVKWDSSKI